MANGGNPNNNPKCGSQTSIHNPTSGQLVQATAVDTCQACAMYDIDTSGSLFTTLAGGTFGRKGDGGLGWGNSSVAKDSVRSANS